jgi:hypothetical protein
MQPEPSPSSAPISSERVRATLERILASPAFRNSRQCQKFLEHVVLNSISGHEEQLKERTIGIDVFGRDPGYDTSGDPVVRVRATEVRKRLAQYYQESGQPEDVRIEIPSGSYRAEVHAQQHAAPSGTPPEQNAAKLRGWTLWVLAGVVCAAAASVWTLRGKTPAPGILDRFWAPVLESRQPVLVYCGQPVVYFLSREVHARYGAPSKPGAAPLAIPPDASLKGSDIVPVTEQFVGIGNAHTSALLAGFFAQRDKPVEFRYASDISFSDLRSSPAVLIGAFSNLWTLEMTSQFRFVFEREGGSGRIRDRSGETRVYELAQQAPDGRTPEDYALVTRQVNAATGQVLITAAGITQYGTRAAGEFLTDARLLEAALAKARADWPSKSLQVLLHAEVYKDTPAAPKVLAVQVW